MRAGTLRHVVEIQVATITPNPDGQPIETWATAFTARCSFEQLSGRELVQAQQVVSDATHILRARYRPDISETNRLRFKGKNFGVLDVDNVKSLNRELVVLCKEIT